MATYDLGAENARTIERLRDLPKELTGKGGGPVRRGLFKAAALIRNNAQARAPIGKDTPLPGRLKANVRLARERNPQREPGSPTEKYRVYVKGGGKQGASARRRFRRQAMAAGASAGGAFRASAQLTPDDAYYWRFVEFGTTKMAPRPFMRPAFESNKLQAVNEFSDELRKAVAKLERNRGKL